jgi:hypothetical protein
MQFARSFAVPMLCLFPASALAQTIDFETLANGQAPSDGLTIDNQYASLGVTFSLGNGSSPVLAKVGSPRTAFEGYNLLDDQPAPGSNTGEWFLTDDGVISGPPSPLKIQYATDVQSASGVLLDIDGQEQWTVQAFDASGVQVGSDQVLGPNNSLEGSATTWSFQFGAPVIRLIILSYSGNQSSGVGLAFDNFSVGVPLEFYCTAKVNSQGCTPTMTTSGIGGVSDPNPFWVGAANVINNKNGILFYGTGALAGSFQGGYLCVAQPFHRTALQNSAGNAPPDDCSGVFAYDMNARIQSGADALLVAGATVYCQYWHRDPPASFTTGLTDAVHFTIAP